MEKNSGTTFETRRTLCLTLVTLAITSLYLQKVGRFPQRGSYRQPLHTSKSELCSQHVPGSSDLSLQLLLRLATWTFITACNVEFHYGFIRGPSLWLAMWTFITAFNVDLHYGLQCGLSLRLSTWTSIMACNVDFHYGLLHGLSLWLAALTFIVACNIDFHYGFLR